MLCRYKKNELLKRVRRVNSQDGTSVVILSHDERVALNEDYGALKAQDAALTRKMPAGAKLPKTLDDVKDRISFIPEYGGHVPLDSLLRR